MLFFVCLCGFLGSKYQSQNPCCPQYNCCLCMFYSHLNPNSAIYFSKAVDIAPNLPTTTGVTITSFMSHILAISSLSSLYFSIFPTSLSFTTSISRYGNTCDLNFLHGFINKNNIWPSNFNLRITLGCKIPQNLVPFVLNNSIWLMLVPLLCSLEVMFFA